MKIYIGFYRAYRTLLSEQVFTLWEFRGRRDEKGTESLCNRRIAENVPNLSRDMDILIQEVQKTPNSF
jgi:hypothetical protein